MLEIITELLKLALEVFLIYSKLVVTFTQGQHVLVLSLLHSCGMILLELVHLTFPILNLQVQSANFELQLVSLLLSLIVLLFMVGSLFFQLRPEPRNLFILVIVLQASGC